MSISIDFFSNQKLINKYNYSGPRYTSYPTALEFNTSYTEQDFQASLLKYNEKDLSVYIHIPFCHKICYFCACNKIIARQSSKVDTYLNYLEKEIKKETSNLKNRKVTQLHFGGGTPTFMDENQFKRIMTFLNQEFNISSNAEISIEVDPNETTVDTIVFLKEVGFNRLSMGIQDLSKKVQEAVNRVEDFEHVKAQIRKAKEIGFTSVNLDLIYGLPFQTESTFKNTLKEVLELDPDRLSIFNYAHLPSKFAAQRKIKEKDLPSADVKLKILENTISYLIENKYNFIGMDHFAKDSDELSKAQKDGTLHRNFQGYTTQAETDMIGFGVSSISMIGDQYAQNTKNLSDYYVRLDNNISVKTKGFVLSEDDCIRRDVIGELICNFQLYFKHIEEKYNIVFNKYFESELQKLAPLVEDGLLELSSDKIVVTDLGRLIIRHICLRFDAYSNIANKYKEFSRII
ncbi:MAG: oxygen-independent coproporphyrinogen III oxidase [Psittacicella sp.]